MSLVTTVVMACLVLKKPLISSNAKADAQIPGLVKLKTVKVTGKTGKSAVLDVEVVNKADTSMLRCHQEMVVNSVTSMMSMKKLVIATRKLVQEVTNTLNLEMLAMLVEAIGSMQDYLVMQQM